MPAFKDLTGKLFGRLTVLGQAPNNKHGQVCWHCVCVEGNETIVTTGGLTTGNTTSCGCSKIERLIKHGHARKRKRTPEYRAYQNMKARALNPNHPEFHLWGGRGITICDRWLNGENGLTGFECFLADMGLRPSPRHEVDRIDPDGIYEPGNCRWATERESAINTRRVHRIPLPDGRIVSLHRFSQELGLPNQKLDNAVRRARTRISRGARPEEEATRVAIQVIFWMLTADMLKGGADCHNAPVRSVLHVLHCL